MLLSLRSSTWQNFPFSETNKWFLLAAKPRICQRGWKWKYGRTSNSSLFFEVFNEFLYTHRLARISSNSIILSSLSLFILCILSISTNSAVSLPSKQEIFWIYLIVWRAESISWFSSRSLQMACSRGIELRILSCT